MKDVFQTEGCLSELRGSLYATSDAVCTDWLLMLARWAHKLAFNRCKMRVVKTPLFTPCIDINFSS